MMRRLAVASVILTAACAGTQKTGDAPADGQKPLSKEERLRITNQPPFDLASCFPRDQELPSPANEGVLVGALLSVRPNVLECLVDPANRGPAASTKVTVKTTVNAQGGTHAITGENLSPAGQQCIQQVLDTRVKPAPLAADAKPVEATYDFDHSNANNPSVTMGINDGSDFSGTVRLAEKSWCECFNGFKASTPPVLAADIHIMKGQGNPAEVVFKPSGSTEGDQLASCLQAKVAATPAKSSTELKFPYRFVFFNSQAPVEASASLPPELRFFQLELARTQSAAASAISFGARTNAADTYDAVVQKYSKTKDYRLFDELSAKCNALVESATAWVSALKAQETVDQTTLALVQELKAKEEGWAPVETASQEALSNTQKDLSAAQQRLAADQGACPKKSYNAPAKKK
ncbi:hypothetical protein G4177_11415 [Corallococcus sp. ZKHCc1 1396]|uniref:Lipoprotein n=1 Tax=Corallococcus soli TaxID=2710757 RepID=A0ABR9PLK3_9BACT|nr:MULTISPECIES: hypothetical protein [Corallococcus]MBE4748769.1 hypothetical protein [Corallococcus soli]MCY1031404.1 hypothetical protein [Corallococcus sp. BB11-1]